MKGKASKIFLAVVILLLVAATAVSTVFSVISFKEVSNLKKANEEREKEAEEDTENVLIGSEYQILSTKNISDAYISGDSSKLNDEDKKTLELAASVLEEIISEDMTDYEKEEAIYKWICENIKHDDGGTVAVQEARGIVDRPYGVLQNKQSVCVGYATTFRLLVNMIGLDCMVMHDTGKGHSWDLVKLDDGCWYIVDCYYDAENFAPLYSHFNMNDEMAYTEYDWDASLYPVANGTKYNYIEQNKVVLKNPMELIERISNLYNDGIKQGYFEIAFDETYENALIAEYIIDGISMRDYSDNGYIDFRTIYKEESMIIVYSYYEFDAGDDEPVWDDSNIDYEAIDRKLDDIFGTGEYYYEEDYINELYDDNTINKIYDEDIATSKDRVEDF